MIDRALLNFGPVQAQSYYFQLIPLSLSMVNKESQLPEQDTIYRFSVSKGSQKFDQNKIPIQANFQIVNSTPVLVINTCRLNFYLPNYTKGKKHQFSLSMVQRQHNEDYSLGQYKINVDQLVTEFKDNNKTRNQFKTNFSEDYELQFEIYIEKNRMNLERNIRDNKAERINKSPLRARRQDKVQSAKKQLGKRPQEQTPSRDREEVAEITPVNRSQVDDEKIEIKTQIYEEKVEIRSPTPPRIEEEVIETVREERTSPARQRVVLTRGNSSKSQKNQGLSQKSGQKVPSIATKQKQLSKLGTPSQIKLASSQRLGATITTTESPAPKNTTQSESKQKILLFLFLIVSAVLTYYSMSPNRRV